MIKMSKWYSRYNSDNAEIRIIFLPYAGGSASIYQDWVSQLPPEVEAILVQLPGRANRFSEALISQMDKLVPELGNALLELPPRPYIIFGHSMGGRIGYQLLEFFKEKEQPLPMHFIASGCKAPHQIRHKSGSYLLPEKEFIQEIERLNATPHEILENKELLNICINILRADFEVADYQTEHPENKYDIPFTLLFGLLDEEVSLDDIEEWRLHFNGKINVKLFNGGHFFINSHTDKVINEINKLCY
ncbi:thioesterase II family protein [Photobacterium alginatilyticum]|uniref:Thioesterase n=2 Tax=Photobacterium alginatilyticum TaxID=1775171 RepID=A0ABW9YEU9_9GAMM|nr:thioesterase [Photobacterium alginatilyticum]